MKTTDRYTPGACNHIPMTTRNLNNYVACVPGRGPGGVT